jgi:hypothetical protein
MQCVEFIQDHFQTVSRELELLDVSINSSVYGNDSYHKPVSVTPSQITTALQLLKDYGSTLNAVRRVLDKAAKQFTNSHHDMEQLRAAMDKMMVEYSWYWGMHNSALYSKPSSWQLEVLQHDCRKAVSASRRHQASS